MSNLVKSAYVVQKDSESRVIDSNQRIAERLRFLTEIMEIEAVQASSEPDEDGFVEGLDAAVVESLLTDPDDGAQDVINSVNAQINEARAELEQLHAQADHVVADAKAQADSVISKAKDQARQEAEQIKAEAKQQGYDAGFAEGMNRAKAAEDEVRAREAQLVRSYEEKLEEIEPSLVEAISSIYESVLGIDLAGRKDVVMYLLQKAMSTIEGGSNYLIHISAEDISYVGEHKDELLATIGSSDSVELITDRTLKEGQCFIETESGIFDCSIGVEMEMLRKELKLLSRSDM